MNKKMDKISKALQKFKDYGYVIVFSPRREGKTALLKQIIFESMQAEKEIALFTAFPKQIAQHDYFDYLGLSQVRIIPDCGRDGYMMKVPNLNAWRWDVYLFDEVHPSWQFLKALREKGKEFAVAATPELLVTSWYDPELRDDELPREISAYGNSHSIELEFNAKWVGPCEAEAETKTPETSPPAFNAFSWLTQGGD